MRTFWFRKLYKRSEMNGVVDEAIIVFHSRASMVDTFNIIEKRRILIIDLWLVVLRFDWEKKGKWSLPR